MHRFLIPDVLLRFGQTEIGGALILDTLLNRNRTLGKWHTSILASPPDRTNHA